MAALISVLSTSSDVCSVRTAANTLATLLKPLQQASARGLDQLRSVAKELGPLVAGLVKCLGVRLASPEVASNAELAAQLAVSASEVLDALDHLRPVLKTPGHELDVQRYGFIRKFMALGLHQTSLQQGLHLYANATGGSATTGGPSASYCSDLQVAAVLNLLACYSALAEAEPCTAQENWDRVHGPATSLLQVLRCTDGAVKAKNQEMVCICVLKAAQPLAQPKVLARLDVQAAVEQLMLVVMCADAFGPTAADQMQQGMLQIVSAIPLQSMHTAADAMLAILEESGTAADVLQLAMRRVFVDLADAGHAHYTVPPTRLSHTAHPTALMVRAALSLAAGSLSVDAKAACRGHSASVLGLWMEVLHDSHTELKSMLLDQPSSSSCARMALEVLQSALARALPALQASDGVRLSSAGRLMELQLSLCAERLSKASSWSEGAPVLRAACTSATLAARLYALHAQFSGDACGLQDMLAGVTNQLLQMLALDGAPEAVGAASLLLLSTQLANTGLDLLASERCGAAAEMLGAAADVACMRLQLLVAAGQQLMACDVAQLTKKCKAHATALLQQTDYHGSMQAVARHVCQLQALLAGDTKLLQPLLKAHARAQISLHLASRHAAACQQQRQDNPCSSRAAKQQQQHGTFGQAANAAEAPGSMWDQDATLTSQLLAAIACGEAAEELRLVLDLLALQEVACVAQEARKQGFGAQEVEQHAAAVAGALVGAYTPEDQPALYARAVLVKATVACHAGQQQEPLDTACQLLEGLLEDDSVAPPMELLDTAALACAQRIVTQARSRLGAPQHEGGLQGATRAVELWSSWLQGRTEGLQRDDGCEDVQQGAVFRLPEATLQAALQVAQLLHLHGCSHMSAVSDALAQVVVQCSSQVPPLESQLQLMAALPAGVSCTAWALCPGPCSSMAKLSAMASDALAPYMQAPGMDCSSTISCPLLHHETLATAAAECAIHLSQQRQADISSSNGAAQGPARLLLLAQCHQVAGHAYLRAGEVTRAFIHTQEALRMTTSLYSLLGCSTGSNSSRSSKHQPSTSSCAPAAVPSKHSATAQHGDGSAADEASVVVTEGNSSIHDYVAGGEGDPAAPSSRSSSGANSGDLGPQPAAPPAAPQVAHAMWAIASSHLCALYQAACTFELAGCAEDALCLCRECIHTAEAFDAAGVLVVANCLLADIQTRKGNYDAALSCLSACTAANAEDQLVLEVLVAASRARYLAATGQHQQAIHVCQTALERCGSYRASATTSSLGSVLDLLSVWWMPGMRVQLSCILADSLQQLEEPGQAHRALQGAQRCLDEASSSGGDGGIAASSAAAAARGWPLQHGLLLYQLGQLTCSGSTGTKGADGAGASGAEVGIVGLTQTHAGGSLHQQFASALQLADEKLEGPIPKKRGAKATKAPPPKAAPAASKGVAAAAAAPSASSAAEQPPASPSQRATALLQALYSCWQCPLVAVAASSQLLCLAMQQGLVHTSALFLHTAHSLPIMQQADMFSAWRQHDRSSAPSSSSSGSASIGQKLHTTLPADCSGVMKHTQAVVAHALTVLQQGGSMSAVEELSKAAVKQLLSRLPHDVVVASITQDEAGRMIVGRLAHGAMPLLVTVATPSAAGSGSTGLSEVLSQLQVLLEESSDSMHAQDVSSHAQKAQWWKVRLSLDQKMQHLLHSMDAESLGPWRCLLLPVPQGDRAALLAAANGIMVEHFSFLEPSSIDDGNADSSGSRGVLLELLALVLAHLDKLTQLEACLLLRAVCQLMCQRSDAGYVMQLHGHLAAAEAAMRLQLLELGASGSGSGRGCGASEAAGQVLSAAAGAAVKPGHPVPLEVEVCRRDVTGAACTSAMAVEQDEAPLVATAVAAAIGKPARSSRLAAMQRQPAKETTAPATRTTRGKKAAPEPPKPQPAVATLQAERAVRTASAAQQPGTKGARGRAKQPASADLPLAELTQGPDPLSEGQPDAHAALDQGRGCKGAHVRAAQDQIPGCKDAPGGTAAASPSCKQLGGTLAAHAAPGPVLLVLGSGLHGLPWESMPSCSGLDVFRLPCLMLAAGAGPSNGTHQPASSSSAPSVAPKAVHPEPAKPAPTAGSSARVVQPKAARNGRKDAPAVPTQQTAGRSRGGGSTAAAAPGSSEGGQSTNDICHSNTLPGPVSNVMELPTSSIYYVLNPSGDLVETQRCFGSLLKEQPGWQGIVGERPSARALLAALEQHEAFVYMGHGSSEQYLPLPAMRRLHSCAAALLVGCSSGRLRLHGQYEPTGAVIGYMLAGCPLLLANLWDVTDRDIDRFFQHLLDSWLGPKATPDNAVQAGAQQQLTRSLSQLVGGSRGACRLPHLIGAAPVCYALPQCRP